MTAPYYERHGVTVLAGDCLDVLRELADSSVDAVICDPPYGLEFMGKAWDRPWAVGMSAPGYTDGADRLTRPSFGDSRNANCRACGGRQRGANRCDCVTPQWDRHPGEDMRAFQAWCEAWARELYRVLKPGGHLAAFGGTRTYHRLTAGIEDAGFEIRDGLQWLYGSGFPKSHSVSKATLSQVESRYGSARCDCVVTADGRPDRDGVRREGRGDAVAAGGSGQVPASEARTADVPLGSSCDRRGLRELRAADTAEAAGSAPVGSTVLLPDVRGRGSEATRLGDSEVRAGMEEPAGGDPAPGQGVPCMREDAGTERVGVACPSPGAVPVRRDEPAGEPGRAVRPVSPRDRSGDGSGAGSDPGRSDARRVVLDGDGGRRAPVARVCSWCGLPDRPWLASLEPLGSALKPAHEPIVLARKPLVGTVAANVLGHGTGALHIDACRVATASRRDREQYEAKCASVVGLDSNRTRDAYGERAGQRTDSASTEGRWPTNVLLDEHAAAELDHQSGTMRARGNVTPTRRSADQARTAYGAFNGGDSAAVDGGDTGGASRFFPTFRWEAKAPTSERPQVDGIAHPTVKPIALMRWLVRLLTPPGGLVLDPFAGSGTTLHAARAEGFRSIGIEREPDYLRLIAARLDARPRAAEAPVTAVDQSEPMDLLDLLNEEAS